MLFVFRVLRILLIDRHLVGSWVVIGLIDPVSLILFDLILVLFDLIGLELVLLFVVLWGLLNLGFLCQLFGFVVVLLFVVC